MKLTTKYKGEQTTLNPFLIAQKGLDKKTVKKLRKVHKERLKVLHMMRLLEPTNIDFETGLKLLAEQITEIDFKLQALWGFPQNANYHKFWELPHCSCPKMDNSDNYPFGYYTVNGDCPIHGDGL